MVDNLTACQWPGPPQNLSNGPYPPAPSHDLLHQHQCSCIIPPHDYHRQLAAMLSFILIQNRQGKTRLAKWYAPYSDDQKIKLKGEFRNNKIVYRRYAGLFFCACVDTNDNELAYLEAIHFFVEVLDAFFGNVCELDLVFNFYKVYAILDEVFLAGEIEETSKQVVLTRLEHLDKLE
uniref:AP-2 complex subunit sigma n=1 Tax=Bionectria ochroleuca TaxID=29856 RepID=A0A8H7NNL6_BIOOC